MQSQYIVVVDMVYKYARAPPTVSQLMGKARSNQIMSLSLHYVRSSETNEMEVDRSRLQELTNQEIIRHEKHGSRAGERCFLYHRLFSATSFLHLRLCCCSCVSTNFSFFICKRKLDTDIVFNYILAAICKENKNLYLLWNLR